MRENRLQINVATGRMTLPVAVLFCLLIWLIGLDSWSELGTLATVALTGYLMIEANTTFSLIRTRTSLPVCIYWCLFSALGFLHPFQWSCCAVPAFMAAAFSLFYSYESARAVFPVFHAFLFLSLGSLAFPQLLYYVPLFLFGAFVFRALSVKSVFAALFGLLVPYLFLFGHAFWHDEMPLFYAPFQELVSSRPVVWSEVSVVEWVSWIVVMVLQMVCSVHYFQVSYQDKSRTRIFLFFWLYLSLFTLLFLLLQPCHLMVLLPIQLIGTSFLAGHLFTLTRNRFASVFFIVMLVSSFLLTCYNLWM